MDLFMVKMSGFKIYDDIITVMNRSDVSDVSDVSAVSAVSAVSDVSAVSTQITKKYCLTINKLPLEHREVIYALILHYANNNRTGIDSVPYHGKKGKSGKGISYNCSKLPDDLQKILTVYVDSISKTIRR